VQVAIGTNDVAVDLATKEVGGKILRQPGPLGSTLRSPLLLIQMAGKWYAFHLFVLLAVKLTTASNLGLVIMK
jgi:hypothetical protein